MSRELTPDKITKKISLKCEQIINITKSNPFFQDGSIFFNEIDY